MGSEAVPSTNGVLGTPVAISADGSTAAIGYAPDHGNLGAVWVFTHSSTGWTQQDIKLLPNDAAGSPFFGSSIALSSDGNTMLIGGDCDSSIPSADPSEQTCVGAAWVFTRSNGVWSQQGAKLIGSPARISQVQGTSVALSADGNTALIGGPGDSGWQGAAWIFTRSGATWTQQGNMLNVSDGPGTSFGDSVALSSDGNTALIGGYGDDTQTGAAWVFTSSGVTWTQQGGKLVGTGAVGNAGQGLSVALSADGATALVAGPGDNNSTGAVWVFTFSEGIWSQQGGKLEGGGGGLNLNWVDTVALSADGNIALNGAFGYSQGTFGFWLYSRSNGAWTQPGGEVSLSGLDLSFLSLGLSAAGDLAALGGLSWSPAGAPLGAAFYVFARPTLSIAATELSVNPGEPFEIAVTAQDSTGATVTGYNDTLHFTSTDPGATLPANATLTNGFGLFPVTLLTRGNQTITATDTVYQNITGTSAAVVAGSDLPPAVWIEASPQSVPLNGSANFLFFVSNQNLGPLSGIGFTDMLPAGLIVAYPSGLLGACGNGTITATAGSGSLSLSGATLPASSMCSFSVNVIGTTPGTKNNVTSPPTSNEGGSGTPASVSLIVVAPPSLAESLGAASIPVNGVTSLTYTIVDPATNSVGLNGVAFTDEFPQGMFVGAPSGLTNTCGGTVTAAAGSGSVSLSGGALAPGNTCAVTVDITVTSAATPYTTGVTTVTSANGGTGNTASVPLSVLVPVTLNTVPAGLSILVDGTSYISGQALQLAPGSIHTISVVTPQPGTPGMRYVFNNWSDGGAVVHAITVPSTPTTYTATFTTQYQLTLAVTPSGSGAVTPASGGFYNAGSSVTLTAVPNAGYAFTGWTGAASPSGSASATVVMTGPESVTAGFQAAGPAPPQVGAVLNGGSFQTGQAAPNTILSLFGANLSCTPAPQVLVNGVPAQVLFASDTQINFVIPSGLGGTGNASLQIACNGVNSAAGTLALAPASPAIFTLTETGTGQGAVLNQNYTVNGAQSPAALSSYIMVYGTGFGNLGPAGSDGLQHLALPVTAMTGNVAAQVTYAGEAPGFTSGLQQINILIPATAPVGPIVPIQLFVDNLSTQSGVTIAIQ